MFLHGAHGWSPALYESKDAQAYWDVPVYAEHTFVPTNRVYT